MERKRGVLLEERERGKKGGVPWGEGRRKRLPVISNVKEVERKPLF